MSAFGPRAVEMLARSQWAVWGDPVPFDELGKAQQDVCRVRAATMLVPVGEANREHLTERVMAAQGRYFDESVALSDRELAEYVVRGVYGS